MPAETPSRPTLAAFLRSRREAADPAGWGFAVGRRRTPGLRREEVAQLAGVSVSWYTWLEQGRDIQVSRAALDRIGAALKLDGAGRRHLLALAGIGATAMLARPGDPVSDALRLLLARLDPAPAYVRSSCMDVLAWNPAAARTFVDWSRLPPEQRNSLRLIFLHPPYRDLIVDWERIARQTLASFRSAYARLGDNPRFATIVEELTAASAEFRALWRSQDARGFGEGVKRVRDDRGVVTDFRYLSLAVEEDPELLVVAFLRQDAGRED